MLFGFFSVKKKLKLSLIITAFFTLSKLKKATINIIPVETNRKEN